MHLKIFVQQKFVLKKFFKDTKLDGEEGVDLEKLEEQERIQ